MNWINMTVTRFVSVHSQGRLGQDKGTAAGERDSGEKNVGLIKGGDKIKETFVLFLYYPNALSI